MNKVMKRVMSVVLSLAVMVSVIAIPVVPAKAGEGEIGLAEYSKIIYHPAGVETLLWMSDTLEDNAKVSVSSSNKSIATVKYDKKTSLAVVKTKKTGMVTINCTVKQGGITYKTSCELTVKKYTNPLSSLKIGKKNYASKLNKSGAFRLGRTVNGEKIQVKVKSGFEFRSISVVDKKGMTKIVPNGEKLTLKKGDSAFIMVSDSNADYRSVFIFN